MAQQFDPAPIGTVLWYCVSIYDQIRDVLARNRQNHFPPEPAVMDIEKYFFILQNCRRIILYNQKGNLMQKEEICEIVYGNPERRPQGRADVLSK